MLFRSVKRTCIQSSRTHTQTIAKDGVAGQENQQTSSFMKIPRLLKVSWFVLPVIAQTFYFAFTQIAEAGYFTNTGGMYEVRYAPTATLLTNGNVLVVGGFSGSSATRYGVEVYNPATGTWSITAAMNEGRRHHTATLLSNGIALIVGGVAA